MILIRRTFVHYYATIPRPNRAPDHLAVLRDYYAEHRLIPSYAAISTLLGFTKTAAASLVSRLEKAGFLRRTPDNRLTPTQRFFELPRSISVRASLPGTVHLSGS